MSRQIGQFVIFRETELLERLGITYRSGYRDGDRQTPFLDGYWLGPVSRAAMNVGACAHESACGPICSCGRDGMSWQPNTGRGPARVNEADLRESIAAEFDVLAGMLTDAMERTTVPIDLAICQDRRAQMATAAQIARGKVAP